MTADLFGVAEPPSDEPRVFSVSEITRTVRAVLEDEIGTVWVEGEVSNYRKQASGHQYFTLKDAQAQLACVWFARGGSRLKQVALTDGMQVQVRGALTVYEARGQYQLNVQLVQAGGAGLLQAKFEALKRKLEAEGLFAAERKRELPGFPAVVGIVTSPTGAALRDMLHVLARRAPWLRVIVSPARVQGEGAAAEIAAGIAALNELAAPPDVIVVARGGGSVEDLWAFNEEAVARAIVASAIPVVSAVGHEIDFTIADFAADLRAPTPSAAAELIAPDAAELTRELGQWATQLRRQMSAALGAQRVRLDFLARSTFFREPEQRLAAAQQRTDLAEEALRRAMREHLVARRQDVGALLAALRQYRPDQLLALRRQHYDALRAKFQARFDEARKEPKARFTRLAAMLRLLAPTATLARGYSITTTTDGSTIRSITDVQRGTQIVTRLADGEVKSRVET
ncbi:MAG: exodeoxyribonuclease VII large subunit [Verrucomicrobia bacterium]|nr:MAG: exodeoxyribonuclease VII large subunit [Verrucomicrobiota bacterium]